MITSKAKEIKPLEIKIEKPPVSKTSGSSTRMYNISFVDDDPMVLKMLSRHFAKNQQYNISTYDSGEALIESISEATDIVVLDYHLSDEVNPDKMNGLAILKKIKALQPDIQVIMLSSQMEVQIAVDCLKKGAVNYVIKDDIMQFNVQKGIESIVKSNALKDEINELSNTIKRDKLLIRGYSIIGIVLVMALYYFWVN